MLAHKDYVIMKAIAVAIAIEMVGFQLLSDYGLVRLYPRGLYWGANILGGFMFGIGMAIAGGCIMGATYRTGEGIVGSGVVLAGIAIGAAATLNYPLAPYSNMLQAASRTQIAGANPTIPLALGISPWFIIIPILAVFVFLAHRSYRKERRAGSLPISIFSKNWPWWFAGVILGLVGVVSYPVAEAAGRTTPLALTGGYVGILAAFVYQNFAFVGWEPAMAVGTILGAGIAASVAHQFRLRTPSPKILGQSLAGGLIMGVGAVLGDGCNITTIMIGVPLFSIGGILAGTFTILGGFIGLLLMSRHR
jgi:hypothetical protein